MYLLIVKYYSLVDSVVARTETDAVHAGYITYVVDMCCEQKILFLYYKYLALFA